MDITPQDTTQQPISDDQELAKALAGVAPDVPEPVVAFTPTTVVPVAPVVDAVPPVVPEVVAPEVPETPVEPVATEPTFVPEVSSFAPTGAGDLESIKKDALLELRPLIDKVELPADEKFDTYLMLLRSTDDSTLIAPAHAAAQAITDETRRAEALLDIIKEIDYLSRGQQPAA